MITKKSPPSAGTLERASKTPGRENDKATKSLVRYASLKAINCQIGVICGNLGFRNLKEKLEGCGRFLAFRHYLDSGKLKLLSGYYCNKHMLCPCCSAARSRRLLGKWLPILFDSKHRDRSRHYLLTLTWPPPAAPLAVSAGPQGEIYKLRANLALGMKEWGLLWQARRKRLKGPLKDVLGAILAVEVTKGPGGWHPHFHILITLPRNRRVDATELRQAWQLRTGGNQIHLDVLRKESDVVEVFKYAVKPADLGADGNVCQEAVETRLLVAEALSGSRLIRGYGCYYNVQEPDLTEQETVEDLGEWVTLIFRWTGEKYEFDREIPGYEV